MPPIHANEAPLFLAPTEAKLVRRHQIYFTFPATSIALSSIVAAIGLASWVLIPWLLYKSQWIQAGILLVNMLVGGPLSHKLSPHNGLILMASRGNVEAVEFLEAFNPAWEKIAEASKHRER